MRHWCPISARILFFLIHSEIHPTVRLAYTCVMVNRRGEHPINPTVCKEKWGLEEGTISLIFGQNLACCCSIRITYLCNIMLAVMTLEMEFIGW